MRQHRARSSYQLLYVFRCEWLSFSVFHPLLATSNPLDKLLVFPTHFNAIVIHVFRIYDKSHGLWRVRKSISSYCLLWFDSFSLFIAANSTQTIVQPSFIRKHENKKNRNNIWKMRCLWITCRKWVWHGGVIWIFKDQRSTLTTGS